MADIHLLTAAAAVLLLFLLGRATSAPQCPLRCACYSGSSDVDCNYCGLRDVPPLSSVPDRTQRFRLKSNFISQIPTRAFQSLTELHHLDLSVNAIAFFDNETFAGLGKLQFLSLSQNKIEGIEGNPFEALSGLKTLLLNKNQIKILDAQGFLGLFNLQILDLSTNSIQQLPKGVFSDVQAPSDIQLSVNNISQIASGVFEGLSQLPTLNLSFNQISDLDNNAFIGVRRSMQRLFLDYNCMLTIPPGVFHDLPALEELSFFGNTIRSISTDLFLDLPSLRSLNLSRNQISMLEPKAFQSLHELEFMDISNNHLETIQGFNFMGLRLMVELNLEFNHIQALEPFSFFGCSSLSVLRLGNNQIHTVQPRAFEGAYFLSALKLENNNLTFWPSEASKSFRFLQTITLFNNLIGELQEGAFGGMVHLQACNLSLNRITGITEGAFGDLVNLRLLDLSRNSLSDLRSNVLQLPKLKMLNVSGNKIYDIYCDAFNGIEALELLNLSDNQLNSVPSCALENLPFLKILDLSSNLIQHLGNGTFSKLDDLQELYIQTNGITSVHPLAFLQLRKLQAINLQNNLLASFDTQWLSNCPELEYLSLSNNKIQTINHRFFSEARPFKTFLAQGNPWCCNCSNFWLTENKSIVDSSLRRLYICHSPAERRGANAFEAISSLPCRAPKVGQIQEASKCEGEKEESLCLTCKATGFPDPEVHWIFPDHTEVESVFDSSSMSHTLKLPPGAPVLGNYTCRAVNAIDVDELQVFVNVFTPSSVVIPHRYAFVEMNGTTNFTCLAKGYPEPSVRWITPRGLQCPVHQLSMELVSHRDIGTYYCVASNSLASINATAYIDFARPPEIHDSPTNFSLLVGCNVVLPCFASGFPPPHVVWKLPNFQCTDSTTSQGRLKVLKRGALQMENLAWRDSGVYVCEALNIAGMDSVHHVVSVLDVFAPSPGSKEYFKLWVVALIVFPVLIGIASLCCMKTCKKHKVKIIQVHPLPEKNLKAQPNDSEMSL